MSIFKYFIHSNNKFQESLTLGEGNTPILKAGKLAELYGLENLYLKDESQNPSGSFKDRGIVLQLAHLITENKKNFTISSSGNAAISAALYCKEFKLNLDIFISDNIEKYKQERLESIQNGVSSITVHYSKRPKKDMFTFAHTTGATMLRQSTDNMAKLGYETIGYEIKEQIKEFDSIFVPTSSGTGILGISEGLGHNYPIFAIQTCKINTFAALFDKNFIPSDSSIATAIVAKYTPLKRKVVEEIEKTNGFSFAISDTELYTTLEEVRQNENLNLSYDSLLSICGLKKALSYGFKMKNPICILTGI